MEMFNLLMALPFLLVSCNEQNKTPFTNIAARKITPENPYQQIGAIPVPAGFERIKADTGSFGAYLRTIGLKEQTIVYLYNRHPKRNQTAQYALLNISVGNTDLQQCADAVMRLRAEYLFAQKQYEQIIFSDNDNTEYRFTSPYNRDHFDKYLNSVFSMCGSASLSKQLKHVKNFTEIRPGDVLIHGGFPGHAVIVMDIALDDAGKKIYLMAQSYMPAQDIHVLKNPTNKEISPWYKVNDNMVIQTPEYTFRQNELMRW